MSSKQLSIVLAVVVAVILGVVGYMTLRDNFQTDDLSQQNTTLNSNSAEKNSVDQVQQQSASTKQYSDQQLSFNYPNSWSVVVKTPKDILPPEASFPCGVVWDNSIECLFLGKNSSTLDSTYNVALAVFQTSQSALQWCQKDEFDEYDNCQTIKSGDNTMVTARTPDSSSPKYTYTILSQNNKVIVLMNVNASTSDISTISKSLKVK
jgi:hypothetical protein